MFNCICTSQLINRYVNIADLPRNMLLNRYDSYLKLISRCETVLVKNHTEVLWDGFQGLIDLDKQDGE